MKNKPQSYHTKHVKSSRVLCAPETESAHQLTWAPSQGSTGSQACCLPAQGQVIMIPGSLGSSAMARWDLMLKPTITPSAIHQITLHL